MTLKYTKWPQKYQMVTKIPNGHKMYKLLPLQDPPKFTQIGISGLKIYVPSGNPGVVQKAAHLS
jgi:hypothetical protein